LTINGAHRHAYGCEHLLGKTFSRRDAGVERRVVFKYAPAPPRRPDYIQRRTFRSTATFAIDDSNRGVTISAPGGQFSGCGHDSTISEPIVGAGTLTERRGNA
jgi:hypothetical protein